MKLFLFLVSFASGFHGGYGRCRRGAKKYSLYTLYEVLLSELICDTVNLLAILILIWGDLRLGLSDEVALPPRATACEVILYHTLPYARQTRQKDHRPSSRKRRPRGKQSRDGNRTDMEGLQTGRPPTGTRLLDIPQGRTTCMFPPSLAPFSKYRIFFALITKRYLSMISNSVHNLLPAVVRPFFGMGSGGRLGSTREVCLADRGFGREGRALLTTRPSCLSGLQLF